MFTNILVPTDGSDLSATAVTQAIKLAAMCGAKITFLFVLPDYSSSVYGEAALLEVASPQAYQKLTVGRSSKVLDAAIAQAVKGGVACSGVAATSDRPYEAIIATAQSQNCEFIVMGSHGRGGVAGAVLGSQTHKVLALSKLPVLVYR